MQKLSLLLVCLLWPLPSVLAAPASGNGKDASELLRQGLFEEEANRDPSKAAAAYAGVVEWYDAQRKLAATAMFRLAEVRVRQGNKAEGTALYQRLLTEFADQDPLAKLSRERLATLGAPVLAPGGSPPAATTDEEGKLLAQYEAEGGGTDFNSVSDLVPYNGTTRMICAADKGWTRLLAFMLDHGGKVDGYGYSGEPIRAAAASGHKDAVELLLARGARIDRAAPDGWTALHAACLGRYPEIVGLLLDKGAKTEVFCARKPDPKTVPVHAWGPDLPKWLPAWKDIPLGSPLLIAVRNGDVDVLTRLLDHHADPNFYAEAGANDKAPMSPLIVALRTGQEGAARLLLDRGANAKFVTPDGFTVLHAAAAGTPTLVETLLARDLPQMADANGWTPLFYSVYLGGSRHRLNEAKGEENVGPLPEFMSHLASYEPAWAAFLAHGADINAPEGEGTRWMLVHYCAPDDYHPTEVPAWLVAHGADINARDSDGVTPLLRFSDRHTVDGAEGMKGVSWLLENGADPGAKDKNGQQPLSYWRGSNGQLLRRKYVLPPLLAKSLGAHAVTALVDTDQRSLLPIRIEQQADFDLPPSLALFMQSVMSRQVYGHLNVDIHHAASVGKEADVDHLGIDFSSGVVDISKWPVLRWGDVVIFGSDRSGYSGSETFYNDLAAGKQRNVTVQIGDELLPLTFADPAADATACWSLLRKRYLQEASAQPIRPPLRRTNATVEPPNARGIGTEPESLLAWTPMAKPLPAWTLSELVFQLTQSRPDARLDAIRLYRTTNGQTQDWTLDLRAANPAEAETDGTGQPTNVKRLGVWLADGDRLVIPRLPADDPTALTARRQIICFAAPGSPFAQPVFTRPSDDSAAHTLGELLMQAYLSPMVIPNPNLSKIVIHRVTGNGAEEQAIPVNLTQTILAVPPSPLDGRDRSIFSGGPSTIQQKLRQTDLALQWGDRVEIPAIEGIDLAKWQSLSPVTTSYLDRLLTRDVRVTFNGQPLAVDKMPTLNPEFHDYLANAQMFPLRFDQNNRAASGAFTALTLLYQLHVNLDTLVRLTLQRGGQSYDYDLPTLKAVNPWIDFDSQVNIQQLSP